MKKGTTLIELIVSITIFLVVTTIVVGAFLTVSRIRTLTGAIRDSQQKTRIAMERVTRLSRQAEKVVVKDNGQTLELYFQIKTIPKTVRFNIANETLKFSDGCLNPSSISRFNLICSQYNTGVDLFGGTYKLTSGSFEKTTGSVFPTLSVKFNGSINGMVASPYFRDTMIIETTIPLEGIR